MAHATGATRSGGKVVKVGEETLTKGSVANCTRRWMAIRPFSPRNLGILVSDDQNSLKIGPRGRRH
jgi:hypothetical protein